MARETRAIEDQQAGGLLHRPADTDVAREDRLALACDHAVHEVTGIWVLARAVTRGLPKQSRDRDALEAIATHAQELVAELTRALGSPAPGTRGRGR